MIKQSRNGRKMSRFDPVARDSCEGKEVFDYPLAEAICAAENERPEYRKIKPYPCKKQHPGMWHIGTKANLQRLLAEKVICVDCYREIRKSRLENHKPRCPKEPLTLGGYQHEAL